MSSITVQSLEEAKAILRRVALGLQDWTSAWVAFNKVLPQYQKAYWDDRFGRGLYHSFSTSSEREDALGRGRGGLGFGYYHENAPGARAESDAPFFEWTGSLREATDYITRMEKLKAIVDTAANYNGPIGGNDPVQDIMVNGPFHVEPWDVDALDEALDKVTEDFAGRVLEEARQ